MRPDDWTYPKGTLPGVIDYERELLVGGIIREAVDTDGPAARFYLTCSVGELAQRIVVAYAEAERLPPGQYRDTAGALRFDGRITDEPR